MALGTVTTRTAEAHFGRTDGPFLKGLVWLRKCGDSTLRLRRVIALGLCCGIQACALRPTLQAWGLLDAPPTEATAPAPPPPIGALRPEAHHFSFGPEQDVLGSLMALPLRDGDTLPDVARHYGLGYADVTAANPDIDPWVPERNSKALIPIQWVLPRAPRKGIVINLAALRLFHFPAGTGGTEVITYPIGIGKEGRSTPTGSLSIIRKKDHPTWYPTQNIRNDHRRKGDPLPAAVPPGPDNPLGEFALYLSRTPYLMHGTNKPYSVGWRASNGCIRLYPENIEQLFPAVPVREPVLIVNQPYLLGWRDGVLYLQAHRPQEELSDNALQKRLRSELKKLEAERGHRLDWVRIDRVLTEARGIPTPISAKAPGIDIVLAQARPLEHPQRFYGAPTIPDAQSDRWNVLVDETSSESVALRLAAFLNHQGPQIPARTESKGNLYRVVAGPFETNKAAQAAVKRLQVELELEGKVIPPVPATAAAAAEDPGDRRDSASTTHAGTNRTVPAADL